MCLHLCAVLGSAQFAQVLGNDLKNLRVCDRKRLPWILEHRHTVQFFLMTHVSRVWLSNQMSSRMLQISLSVRAALDDVHRSYLWQRRSARHGAFEPQMSLQKRHVLANTSASSQSHVSQSHESVVVDDRQKPVHLFEQSSRTCTSAPIRLCISVYNFATCGVVLR